MQSAYNCFIISVVGRLRVSVVLAKAPHVPMQAKVFLKQIFPGKPPAVSIPLRK